MSIKPRTGRRNYAKGGLIQMTDPVEDEEGNQVQPARFLKTGKGTPFVDAEKYPGWPQMAPMTLKGVTEA
jgi:hypothetical protein